MGFEANRRKFFAISEGFMMLTDSPDAEMSRSGVFCADNRQ